MSTGYQINDQEGLYYLTFQIVDWIDVFTRQVYRDIIINSFKYAIENKSFDVFAFVIMSNHVHLIAQSNNGRLSSTIGDIKKFTSKKIIETIQTISESRAVWMLNRFRFNAKQHSGNECFQVWTHENHVVYLYSPKFIREKIDYLHNNPVRAGMVEKPEDYLHSSARWYAGLDCVLPISDIGLPWRTVR
jgi:REP element-mobilizing transposase RayT